MLRDEALNEIAAQEPGTREELWNLRSLSRGHVGKNSADALLAIVAEVRAAAPSTYPKERKPPPAANHAGPSADLLKVLLKLRCEENDVAQKLVASADDIEAIARTTWPRYARSGAGGREIFGEDALASSMAGSRSASRTATFGSSEMPGNPAGRQLRTATVVSHVGFEDLGILAPLLAERGIAVGHVDAPRDSLAEVDTTSPDLLIVLGGPIGVYEADIYPFLSHEIAMVGERLARGLPTLGICLGAQLMAAALGARVYPSGFKEIGWKPLTLSGRGAGVLPRSAAEENLSVLHWHGDTFDLPDGATHLASSDLCENQAFLFGRQCARPPVPSRNLGPRRSNRGSSATRWKSAAAGLSLTELREDSRRLAGACNAAGKACFTAWLDGLEADPV